MKLKIIEVQGIGDYDKELVLLQAEDDCDVGRYLLADSTYTANGKVSNEVRHTFWFPDKEIKKGEYVAVWTKPGKSAEVTFRERPLHRFFWGLSKAVWNDDGDCAVLMHVPSWQFFKVKGK